MKNLESNLTFGTHRLTFTLISVSRSPEVRHSFEICHTHTHTTVVQILIVEVGIVASMVCHKSHFVNHSDISTKHCR